MSTRVESPKSLTSFQETVHYSVTADAHPGALPCVLALFARRGITPDLVKVHRYKQDDFFENNVSIEIHVTGLSAQEQNIIFHKLAAQIAVQNVRDEILFQKTQPKLAS